LHTPLQVLKMQINCAVSTLKFDSCHHYNQCQEQSRGGEQKILKAQLEGQLSQKMPPCAHA
jgi:uncharacterized ParB-like nuclease family protein